MDFQEYQDRVHANLIEALCRKTDAVLLQMYQQQTDEEIQSLEDQWERS